MINSAGTILYRAGRYHRSTLSLPSCSSVSVFSPLRH